MRGPQILARTLSAPTRRAGSERAWQYNSRSDHHSKVACWTVLFDLLVECDALRTSASAGRIGFGINREMVGPINKKLDLVVTTTQSNRAAALRERFADLVPQYGIVLTADDQRALAALPAIEMDHKRDLPTVAVALEAKACMTEHVKSLPRLYAELLAAGFVAKSASPNCITAAYSIVNAAPSFVTPSGDGRLNRHNQPDVTRRVLSMIRDAVPTAPSNQYGYDAVGVTVLNCRNDGSTPVTVADELEHAPKYTDRIRYEQMITKICSEFYSRFAR